MSLNLIPTAYKVTHLGWAYKIYLGYKDRGWIVQRRKENDANIPPFLHVWTAKGWVSVLSEDSHDPILFANTVVVRRMIEEQTDE